MAIALADLIDPALITLNLRARTQTYALREIVDLVGSHQQIDDLTHRVRLRPRTKLQRDLLWID